MLNTTRVDVTLARFHPAQPVVFQRRLSHNARSRDAFASIMHRTKENVNKLRHCPIRGGTASDRGPRPCARPATAPGVVRARAVLDVRQKASCGVGCGQPPPPQSQRACARCGLRPRGPWPCGCGRLAVTPRFRSSNDELFVLHTTQRTRPRNKMNPSERSPHRSTAHGACRPRVPS